MSAPALSKAKLAYTYDEAAGATGHSVSIIRRAVRESYLTAVVPQGTSKPVIRAQELESWLDQSTAA